jgi:hypothetical protein
MKPIKLAYNDEKCKRQLFADLKLLAIDDRTNKKILRCIFTIEITFAQYQIFYNIS